MTIVVIIQYFSLLGRYVDIEVRTATGRVDMVMTTATKLYLIEFFSYRIVS